MNYSPIFTIAARAESAYTTAQAFIANQCPILEQRLKSAALSTTVNVLTLALIVIDWASAQLSKADEYRLIVALAYINSKRFAVRQLIAVARFNQHYKFTATLRRLWDIKGCIFRKTLDKLFCLELDEDKFNSRQFSK